MKFPRQTRRQAGFTLVELMIAVVIVGILAAIAYPSYLGQVRKSQRAGAQSVLMQVAQKEMQLFLDARSYVAAANTAAVAAAPIRVSVDAKLASLYTFVVTADNSATPPTFTVTATAQGNQALDSGCSTLTINQAGVKSPASGCW